MNLQDTPSLSSPGIDTEEPEENAEDDKELDPVSAKQYGGIAARCKYLSSDRPELQFSVKRSMHGNEQAYGALVVEVDSYWSVSQGPTAVGVAISSLAHPRGLGHLR